ncbi:MAG TPA: DUF559 domain-containing protein, partial [Longimicrobium sp.]|nr:DUF559 domain-containing protein [Longimicrobium sp.]
WVSCKKFRYSAHSEPAATRRRAWRCRSRRTPRRTSGRSGCNQIDEEPKKLCIEVDGGIHDQHRERDAERTAWLEAAGFRVLRFRNEDVMEARHLVARRIQDALRPQG